MRIPDDMRVDFDRLTPRSQAYIAERYQRRSVSMLYSYILLVLGFHHLYMGKILTWAIYSITARGLLIWMLIDMFRLQKMVADHNTSLIRELVSSRANPGL